MQLTHKGAPFGAPFFLPNARPLEIKRGLDAPFLRGQVFQTARAGPGAAVPTRKDVEHAFNALLPERLTFLDSMLSWPRDCTIIGLVPGVQPRLGLGKRLKPGLQFLGGLDAGGGGHLTLLTSSSP